MHGDICCIFLVFFIFCCIKAQTDCIRNFDVFMYGQINKKKIKNLEKIFYLFDEIRIHSIYIHL